MASAILWLLVIGYIAICFFLLLFILLQSGKGGGLSGLASAGPLSESLGVAGSEKSLSRWTTYCTVAFFIITLIITFLGAQKLRKSTSLLGNLPSSASQPTTQKPQTTPPQPASVSPQEQPREQIPAPQSSPVVERKTQAPSAEVRESEQPMTVKPQAESPPIEKPQSTDKPSK